MKICLFGGLANNLYIIAKGLSRFNSDIYFIRDIFDAFPFSQPVWEDCRLSLPYGEVYKKRSLDDWVKTESRLGWNMPHWCHEPGKYPYSTVKLLANYRFDTFLYLRKRKENYLDIINRMKSCDLIVCCGVLSAVLAYYSKRPYVILPHGSDIFYVAEVDKKVNKFYPFYLKRLAREAFKKASSIVVSIRNMEWLIKATERLNQRLMYLPIPMDTYTPAENECDKRERAGKLFEELKLNIPAYERLIFIPSRIDFYWKGTDRIIEAIKSNKRLMNLHFIFSGWGDDYLKAKELLLGQKNVTMLNRAISKPIIYNFFRASDLVIDQFTLGHYGTAAMEAMGCGAPVMAYLDNSTAAHEDVAPIINVSTAKQIEGQLCHIAAGKIDLERLAMLSADWSKKHQSSRVCFSAIQDIYKAIR